MLVLQELKYDEMYVTDLWRKAICNRKASGCSFPFKFNILQSCGMLIHLQDCVLLLF